MKAPWQRWLHRCARALGWTAGITVIVLAVLIALAQLLLPLLGRHPAWVAAQLGARLQRPVSFSGMEGRWSTSGPLFVMHDLAIGAGQGEHGEALRVPESVLKIDLGAWLVPSRHLFNLHVRGLQLDLLHDAAGWHVNGIGVAGGRDRQPLSLHRLSLDLWLEDLRVVVDDASAGRNYTLISPRLRISHQGNHVRFGGTLQRHGVSAVMQTAGRFREDGRAGRIWLSAAVTDLKPLLQGVQLDGYTAIDGGGRMAAWLDWKRGRLERALLRVDLDRLVVASPAGVTAGVAALHGLAGLRPTADGYALRWAGADHGALALDLHRPGTPAAHAGLAASRLQLAPLLPWLALKPGLSPALAQWLGSGHPRGELQHAALQWSQADGVRALDVGFQALAIDAVGKLPGLSALAGELRGDGQSFALSLPQQPATLTFVDAFRQPFELSGFGGTLAYWRGPDGWHLGVDPLAFAGAGYAGQLRGEVLFPHEGGAPFLDLYANVDHADVLAAKLFWPLHGMSERTVNWLDRALVSGTVEEARVAVRGSLADWPFRQHEGRFEARAVLRDLSLDYGERWPRADGIDAVATFTDNGMLVEAEGGRSLGVGVDHAVALIPDFAHPLLDLNVQGHGSGASLLGFARTSPVASAQADTLAKLQLGGSGTFGFHLVLPLTDVAAMQLTGSAQLTGADVSAPEWNLKLDQLTGPLTFDAHGLQAGPLQAGFHGQPATVQLAIAGANSDPGTLLSARLQGRYGIGELVADYPSLGWLGQLSEGRSDFDIGFSIAHVSGSDALAQQLRVDSPLEGIALALPAPLDKPAATTLPLHLQMNLPLAGSDMQLALGPTMRGHLRLADDTHPRLRGSLAFGGQEPEPLPAQGLRIRGHAPALDITGWVQRVAGGSGGEDGPMLESIDIATEHAQWFGSPLGAMKIQARPQAQMLAVQVDGAAIAGKFSVPTQDLRKRGVTARLQRLYWPKAPDTEGAPAATAKKPPENPAATGIDPAALPPFHLWVGDLRLGEGKLGEARLETWPTPNGLHIEQLRALSSQVQITASGDWNGSASDSHTRMHIAFAAEDLGAMLGAFGYDGLVMGGTTHDELDASWPGGPSALSLATMDGTLGIQVKDGRIPEATPGVGRLLGLVSLAELPRRLTLDFGDVFGKGLAFDSITGTFHLANGNATTDKLVIAGPAANITISGRTGLRARDYDQQVRVVPHVGNSLPVVGAVVGGPIGAAAGFAVQGLLGKGLNQAASARYRVTGSWDKPVMTLIEKHGVPPRPPVAPVSPATTAPAPAMSAAPAPAGSAG